jgi:putative hydrolase of the HAD superfamily
MRALVLDWDGVLARFDLTGARAALSSFLSLDLEELGRRIQRHEAAVGSPRGATEERSFWLDFSRALAADLDLGADALLRLERFDPRSVVRAYPDARGALERARERGLRVGVLSNFTLLDLRASLSAIGLADLVDVALSAAAIGAAKPEPAASHAITRALEVAPGDCLFVDDRPEHVAGAAAVGMTATLLARPPQAQSTALGSLDELDHLLERRFGRQHPHRQPRGAARHHGGPRATTDDRQTEDRVLRISRVLEAPPERVWTAWTDADVLPKWFGAKGFSCRTKEIDLRPGGVWIFDMIGPDGTAYLNRHRILFHARPHRIVYPLDGEGGPHDDAPVEVVVTMEAVPEGTRLTLQMTFPTAAHRKEAADFGAEALEQQTLGKLARVVEAD